MDRQAIAAQLDELRLTTLNRRVVRYWLDLCQDKPPTEASFDLAGLGETLVGCMLFDVTIGQSVICRMAGTIYAALFGRELAGCDWLAMTPAPHRRARLVRYSAVAQGAIGIGRRKARTHDSQMIRVEEVMLPFARSAGSSRVTVLIHTDWRPSGRDWLGMQANVALEVADDFRLIELP